MEIEHDLYHANSKVEGDKEISDFWPISLLNGIYKLIGKTLAIRLKRVLNDLISDYQCGGLPERHIHEGVLVANELIDSRLKSKKHGLLHKIDFKKAFDTVSWDFIDIPFWKFGFSATWRHWLCTCWFKARFSVLLNGKPEDFFHSSRGLSKGSFIPSYFCFGYGGTDKKCS